MRAGLEDLGDFGGARLPTVELALGTGSNVSFEETCKNLEEEFCKAEHHLVCECCAHEIDGSPCPSCRFAIGFHICQQRPEHYRWCKGTLYAGSYDISLMLYRLHKKMLPIEALKEIH